MGVRTRNLKALFADTRTRTIIVITGILLLVAIFAGYTLFHKRVQGPGTGASLTGTPGNIQSVPGSFNPTEQYAKLQEEQNTLQAQQAEKNGTSAIPTIIRVTAPTTGIFSGPQNGNTALALALQAVQRGSCDAADLAAAMKAGATAAQLRTAGCSAQQLRAAGFSADALQKAGFSACDMLSSNGGYDPTTLKNAGYSAGELRGVGFNACQLRKAGFNANDLRQAGFTPDELKGVGFTPDEIAAAGYGPVQVAGPGSTGVYAGLPPGVTPTDILQAGCTADAIAKEKQEGVSATAIRNISGCSASQLKAGGYSAADLKNAGFTAADLKAAGFSPKDLKDAGYSAGDLLAAGYTPADLAAAGYTPAEIAQGEQQYKALAPADILAAIKQSGCTAEVAAKAHAEGVSASSLRQLGCTASALKNGGYTAQELKNAGFTPGELRAAGFTPAQLKQAGFSAADLRNAGYSPSDLQSAGFTPDQLKDAGYTAAELRAAGFTPQQLKDLGYTAADLRDAGFTPDQLKQAGYTAQQLKDAGYSAADLKNAGFTPADLRAAGFSAQDLKNAGFTAPQLRAAGFNASQLSNAGYSPADLQSAGYSPGELSQVGIPTTGTTGVPPQLPNATGVTSPGLQTALDRQQQQIQAQQIQAQTQQAQSAMSTQASQLFAAWKSPTQVYVEGTPPTAGTSDTGIAGAAGSSTSTSANTMVKAGTIMYAVLETAVNSDEPGPVLATIITGPLKGAKLIGGLTTFPPLGKKVMLTFNLMTLPSVTSSFTINAVAVDQNTARTALSSYTNNHIILKYGSLFAASFLEGYGQAFLQSGQQIVSTASSTTSISQSLSPAGKFYVALGNVGNQFGQVLQNIYNMPSTVYVYSGTGLGILFLQDVATPAGMAPLTAQQQPQAGW